MSRCMVTIKQLVGKKLNQDIIKLKTIPIKIKCHYLGYAQSYTMYQTLKLRNCSPASKLSIWGISWKVDAREARERRRKGGGGGLRRSLVRSLASHFAHPNRRACLQAKELPGLFTAFSLDNKDSMRSHDATATRTSKTTALNLVGKTRTLHVHVTFSYFSLQFLHDYDVKLPNFTF